MLAPSVRDQARPGPPQAGERPRRRARRGAAARTRTLTIVERLDLDVPSPIVKIEWDRGHAVVSGIVRAWDDGGIVITRIHDHAPVDGLIWIDAREVLRHDDLRPDHPGVRLADLTGERLWAIDRSMAELPVLLATLQHDGHLVRIQVAATGSRAGKVGRIASVDAQRVVLRDVAASARWSGELEMVDLDDIVAVHWDDTYLRSVATLLEAESSGWIPPL